VQIARLARYKFITGTATLPTLAPPAASRRQVKADYRTESSYLRRAYTTVSATGIVIILANLVMV